MKLKTLILTMESDKLIRGDATKLRGFFATKFNEYVLLHQHLKNHKFLYKSDLDLFPFPKVLQFGDEFPMLSYRI